MPKKSKPIGNGNIRVYISHIKWDTDGQRGLGLPKKVMIDITKENDATLDNIHDTAIEKLSDEYGYCIQSCYMDNIEIG
jgi:hypothetical protein